MVMIVAPKARANQSSKRRVKKQSELGGFQAGRGFILGSLKHGEIAAWIQDESAADTGKSGRVERLLADKKEPTHSMTVDGPWHSALPLEGIGDGLQGAAVQSPGLNCSQAIPRRAALLDNVCQLVGEEFVILAGAGCKINVLPVDVGFGA